MDVFWQTINGTFLATVLGGIIASFVGYWLSKRASSIAATYDIVKNVLSDDFTSRRKGVKDSIKSGVTFIDICHSDVGKPEIYKIRSDIIFLLNYYDTVMHGVDDGALSGDVIKKTIWSMMKQDHDSFEDFIEPYSRFYAATPRPLFPALRKYHKEWG
ncbi:DUF4760 domain-containing protein [Neoaquamicrobium sediminum]|uniref:DUF4760 domain-containing protein n=1 Tax=Neoaquamicrobium sediminum TaxID=1849104 RepID=UPI003BAA62EB